MQSEGRATGGRRDTVEAEEGERKGRPYPVACKTWFTSAGEILPLSFKFQDDSGELQTVANVRVRSSEQKNYSGIPSREFSCQAVIGGLLREFYLIFYQETCQWRMMI